jgi:hypothetical protein
MVRDRYRTLALQKVLGEMFAKLGNSYADRFHGYTCMNYSGRVNATIRGNYRYTMESVSASRPSGCPDTSLHTVWDYAGEKHPWLSETELKALQ